MLLVIKKISKTRNFIGFKAIYKWLSALLNTFVMIKYNLKIVFGNRFVYFLISAIVISFLIIGINLFNGEMINEKGVYNILLLTGSLLVFYPSAFGIQSDKDARTMEIIFGIPDYRFRVWFMRLLIIYGLAFIILIFIAYLIRYIFVSFAVFEMVFQVLFPLAFMGFLTFFLSTVLRSGNATAATIIILGFILMVLSDEISQSMWNVFFNPYDMPSGTSEMVWDLLKSKNRIFLGSGAIISLLGALMNLQKREKLLG